MFHVSLLHIKYRAARYFKITKSFGEIPHANVIDNAAALNRTLRFNLAIFAHTFVNSRRSPENNGFLRLGKFIEKNEKTYSHSIRRSYYSSMFVQNAHSSQKEHSTFSHISTSSTHWKLVSNAFKSAYKSDHHIVCCFVAVALYGKYNNFFLTSCLRVCVTRACFSSWAESRGLRMTNWVYISHEKIVLWTAFIASLVRQRRI
jgi:hypothetical protein